MTQDADGRRRIRRWALWAIALFVAGMTVRHAVVPHSAVTTAASPAAQAHGVGLGPDAVAENPDEGTEAVATETTVVGAGTAGRSVAGSPAPRRTAAAVVRVVASATTAAQQAQSKQHWTPAAMAAARPVAAPAALGRTTSVAAGATTTAVDSTAPTSTGTATGAATTSTSTSSSSTTAVTTPATPATSPPASPTVAADLGTAYSGSGLVVRTTGKVFFTADRTNYTCSASAVDSPNGATVMTAAHCVLGSRAVATAWVFVPAWDGTHTPYGVFAATRIAYLGGYLAGDATQDVAFVTVGRNDAGQTLGQAVVGQKIRFTTTDAPDQVSLPVQTFGYPGAAPYTGSQLVRCAGPTLLDDRGSGDRGLRCDMTPGSSGGPWLADVDASGAGVLVSLTSFGYRALPGYLFGPPLGPQAAALYASVSSAAVT